MFRRRPIGTGRRLVNRAKVLLMQAHRLFDEGQYLRSALLFEKLAQSALERKLPRAPFLFLQAGKAYVYAEQNDRGLALTWAGLKELAAQNRWLELERFGNKTVAELSERGLSAASESIRKWLDEQLAGVKSQLPTGEKTSERPLLPTKCPSCGGSVDPQTVNWLDRVTVECLYCGSAVRAEN